MTANIQTLENNRAKFAFEMVYEAKNVKELSQNKNEYVSWAKKIPVFIKTNGLGQTLAFMKSRNKPETNLMLKQIQKWLAKKQQIKDHEDLVEKVTQIDSLTYRLWSKEILALFNWVRRFAEGYLRE
jgi:CRISPR-associated protein Cmr5